MPGKGAEKRRRGTALTAFRLHKQGWKHNEIAERLKIQTDKVRKEILLGERLSQLEKENR